MYLWSNQVTFYSKPQNNVLYILARGWFRELHKRCVEARGQHILHTLAPPCRLCARGPEVRQVCARGHVANVHCHATRIVRVGVHCAFTHLARATPPLVRAALMRFHAHTRSHSAVCGVFLRAIQLSHADRILRMLAFYSKLCNARCILSFIRISERTSISLLTLCARSP